MEYFEILLLVLMALAGLVILALVVGSGHRSRPDPRQGTPRPHRSPEPALVGDLRQSHATTSQDHDPRGQEAVPAE